MVSLVVAVVAVAGGTLAMVLPASAAGGCAALISRLVSIPSQDRGQIAVMSVGRPLRDWTLRFQLRYPTEQVKFIAGVRWEQHGSQVTVRSLPGGELPAGERVSFDLVMTHGVKRFNQPVFTLNGNTCTVPLLPPPPWPTASIPPSTSPPPSPSPTPSEFLVRPVVRVTKPESADHFFAPATVRVEATATPSSGRQITRVEFYGDIDMLFGTDTTAPYTAEWHDVPAGIHSVQAVAYDDHGSQMLDSLAYIRVLTPGEERQAPYVNVVRDRLWGFSPVIDAAAPRPLRPLARSGAESRCVHGQGIWDGPVDTDAVAGLVARGVQAVYIPLNEACWLGLPYVDARYGGEPYRQEVAAYVERLSTAGITPIVALAWSHGLYTGPGAECHDERAVCAKPMPNAEYSRQFWQSVSTQLPWTVVYDLFAAPYPDKAISDPTQAWTCWRDGGSACEALGYRVTGMDHLQAFLWGGRGGGARLAAGLRGGSDLSRWVEFQPDDMHHNAAAAWRPAAPGGCRPPRLPEVPVVVTAPCR